MEKNHDIFPNNLAHWLADEPLNVPTREELDAAEEALVAFSWAHAQDPPLSIKQKIKAQMRQFNAQAASQNPFSADNPPLLAPESNWLDWADAVAHIPPPDDFDNIHLHPLVSDEKRELFVAWVRQYIEEEVHHDLLESFMLLDGSCECHITAPDHSTRTVRLHAGQYLALAIGESHNIVITSPQPVKAILQWVKIA